MAKKALILVEGHERVTGPRYVQAARRLRLDPIIFAADPSEYGRMEAEGNETIRVDTNNLHALIHECSRLSATYDIAGITGLRESVYATVGKLCQRFGLPGPNAASIERCCDKFAQRQLLAKAAIPMPAYRLAANAQDVESAAAEIGLPVVLKPAIGSGSSGVRLCRDVEEVAEHATHLLSGKHIGGSSPGMLVEEFVQGPYHSVDIMGDEIIGVAVADFGPPPYFVFHGTTYPAKLNSAEYKCIADVSLSCLRALDLDWGPKNIEFRWTKRGPVVIEVNPRLSGLPDPQLVEAAYGVDLIAEHIKLVIGEVCDLRRTRSHVAIARKLVADCDGIVEWIYGGGRAAAVPGVAEVELYVGPKTRIVRKGDYRDCIGHIIAASPSHATTEAILQRAVDLIDWSITPFSSGEREQS
ncbi:conserved hypothetical protein [Mesorhizobium plurifarium]|uniref:ATP-grasp domain-containing protein n=1 Tax=Mesorhizobium plurifarium TaxID=69974 RepID=A0A090E1X8_MESPL|nr:conserved hypothetical protein [Mesorhizobium plurifarium]